jgi:hypothetical protein
MNIAVSEIYEHSYINDFELDSLLSENPTLYLRRMWGYLNMGRKLVHTPLLLAVIPVVPPVFGTDDAYTDGWFDVPDDFAFKDDLVHLMRIAMLVVWEERFTGNALDRVSKVSDRTASFHSEGNWVKQNEVRAQGAKAWLTSEMNKVQDKMTLLSGKQSL